MKESDGNGLSWPRIRRSVILGEVILTNEPRPSIAPFSLETGRRIIIQADTPRGHYTLKGEVVYVSNHHFRVSADTRAPNGVFSPNQEVRISLEGKTDILPIMTRFIRFTDDSSRVAILAIPEGTWKKNRRAFFRGTIEANVTIIRKSGSIDKGRAVDISGGGLLVETQVALMPREEFDIVIYFSESDQVCATVRVVRKTEADDHIRYGVKFLSIHRRDQDRICRMVIVQEFEKRRTEIKELNENAPFTAR